MAPVSLLASITDTNAGRPTLASIAFSAARSTTPAPSTGMVRISSGAKPPPASTDGCSVAPTSSALSSTGLPPTRQSGVSTVLLASVPPLVKVTSFASPPTKRATALRARSTRARAARPSACTDDALPTSPSAATMAARATGRRGAVAL